MICFHDTGGDYDEDALRQCTKIISGYYQYLYSLITSDNYNAIIPTVVMCRMRIKTDSNTIIIH